MFRTTAHGAPLAVILLAGSASIPGSARAEIFPGTLTTAVGETVRVLESGPESAPVASVLVHDWFGVSAAYREAIERLAALGHRVVALDLYDGRAATTHRDAWNLMQALDAAAAARGIDAALASVARDGRRVALVAFSMGCPHAMRAAIRNGPAVDATVVFYGETVDDPQALASLGGPVLAIYGSRDGDAAAQAAAFSAAADSAGVGAEIYIYPGAHHAFAQPLFNEGRTYDAVAARAAWTLAEDFLFRRLRAADPAED